MANEINLNLTLSVSKNGASSSFTVSKVIDMTGDQFINNVQIVGTSNEALLFGDVSTIGFVAVKNLDATNYVEVFLDSGNANLVAKLFPGEACLFKPGATNLMFARANTGACNCQVLALEL